jgi:PAS domain S-box-containing protein
MARGSKGKKSGLLPDDVTGIKQKLIETQNERDHYRIESFQLEQIFNHTIPLCMTDKNFTIQKVNQAYAEMVNKDPQSCIGKKCYDNRSSDKCHTPECPMILIMDNNHGVAECECCTSDDRKEKRHCMITTKAYYDRKGEIAGIIESFLDITERKKIEQKRDKLIKKLNKAASEIKTLKGILPLCSYCKKIRDDEGYWEQVDTYIHENTNADISHGICPDCLKQHFPEHYEEIKNDKDSSVKLK